MKNDVPASSLLGHLQKVMDGRRQEGKIYPLWSMLGMLVLAALNGQKTLRSMWLCCEKRWGTISRPLGFTGQAHAPSYGAVWYTLHQLDIDQLEQETQNWSGQVRAQEPEGWSLDGKFLRGSRRADPSEAALQVVTMVAQTLKQVMGQQDVTDGDQIEANLALLKAVPLEGKLVTLDASLLRREVANTIVEQGGDYLGPIKGNEAELKEAVDAWIAGQIFPHGTLRPADFIQDNKGHGRIERREVWFVPAVELDRYLLKERGWKHLRLVGKIRCSLRLTRDTQWRSQEMTTWVCSRDPDTITVDQVAQALRHHRTVENGVFYVRDVSYGEDRSHARLVGVAMSAIRNLAISIIRKAAYPFMTDAWADISACPDLGFSLLLK